MIDIHVVLTRCCLSYRTVLMDSTGSLEGQLEVVKGLARDIAMRKEALRKVEELGAQIEEALIFDNKWV